MPMADEGPRIPASQPPRPQARPTERTFHGDTVVDPYAWLLDRADPAVQSHLAAENAWTQAVTGPLGECRAAIFEEIRRRTQETDLSVPVRDGRWWYLTRTREGQAYPVQCRTPDDGTTLAPVEDADAEMVVLDLNELAEPGGYLSLGVFDISPDGRWLAYALDRDGHEHHTLRFRDLRTAQDRDEVLTDVSYGFAWAADSRTCWYTRIDEAERPHEVWRHEVGTDPTRDVRVFHEPDERYHVSVAPSRSGRLAVISTASAVTSECWLLDAHEPETEPVVVAPRRQGVEYSLSHRGDDLWVVTNRDQAEDFALWRAPLVGLHTAPADEWELVVAHRAGRRLSAVEAFASHLVLHGRADAATAIWVLDPESRRLEPLEMDDPVGTLSAGDNRSFDATTYRFTYESLATPPSVIDLEVTTGERTVRKRVAVLDGFDPAAYATAREWAIAPDGTSVPLSLVWRPDATPASGPAPCLLYGYGAYEAPMDPWFSIARLSLLDRGVVFAIAHVRGGGELGRAWYTDGKLAAKVHSFDDFIACAAHLCDTGRTAPDRLAARGASAGGLLMGAVANRAPERFAAVVAEVPFVDPLTTMVDPSLPLTVIEWEEWGDPINDPAAYRWMKAYSPYENVRPAAEGPYPAILATAGLNDPRVGVHEPAKWVARLRDQGHGLTGSRPVLLKVEMGAGHGGPSGRYDAWRDEAFVLAFIVAAIGAE
jgi:oligopeptidase B